jgi:hypothetical protein
MVGSLIGFGLVCALAGWVTSEVSLKREIALDKIRACEHNWNRDVLEVIEYRGPGMRAVENYQCPLCGYQEPKINKEAE